MQILNKTFLYTLLAFILAAGAVFAFMPAQASADITQNCGCDISITQAPSSADVDDNVGPFTVAVNCLQSDYHTYSLENTTDGEYIMGPSSYNDEGRYTFSSNHSFSSSGTKQLRAEVQGISSESCDFTDSDTDSISVGGSSGGASMSVDINGPSSVTIPSGANSVTREYTADFNWSGDSAQYRFFKQDNSYNSGYSNLSGSSASDDIPFTDTGTYSVCAQAYANDGGIIDGDTNCMSVNVQQGDDPVEDCMDPNATNYNPDADIHDPDACEYDNPDPGDATLRVNSSNPSSGAGMQITSDGNSNMPSNFNSGKTFTKGDDIIVTIWADSTANGNNFSDWEGCDSSSNRRCDVRVNTDNSKTITANYSGGGTPPPSGGSDAVLQVNSTNPSSGAGMDVTQGSFGDFNTEQTITRDADIDATIWARTPVNGHNFSDWDGCDADSNRRCDVQVSTGQTQTITANYSGGPPPPPPPSGQAVLNVYSDNPSSGIEIDVLNSNDINSDFDTPKTFQQGDRITATLWAPKTAGGGNTFGDWEGCADVGTNGRRCDVDVAVDETMNITAEYNNAPDPDPAEIDNFNLSDPNLDTSVNPPELHVDDQPFSLVWSTTNANSVEGDWGGNPKNLNDSENINEGSISGNEQTFSYTLTAYGDGGNESATEEVTLLDPPRFSLSSDPETDIGGEPGSQATLEVTATSSSKFNGNIFLEVKDENISLTKLSKLNFLFRTGRFSWRAKGIPSGKKAIAS